MFILCVCGTVKTQFDNTGTCALHSVNMLPSPFDPPLFENSGSAPADLFYGCVTCNVCKVMWVNTVCLIVLE